MNERANLVTSICNRSTYDKHLHAYPCICDRQIRDMTFMQSNRIESFISSFRYRNIQCLNYNQEYIYIYIWGIFLKIIIASFLFSFVFNILYVDKKRHVNSKYKFVQNYHLPTRVSEELNQIPINANETYSLHSIIFLINLKINCNNIRNKEELSLKDFEL